LGRPDDLSKQFLCLNVQWDRTLMVNGKGHMYL